MGSTGWLRRVGPWVGIGTSPAALMMGGGVAQGLEGWRLPIAMTLGVALLAILALVQGLVGQRAAAPFLTVAASALGTRGSRMIASPVMLAMMLGWYALNVSVAGTALGRLLGFPDQVGMALFAGITLAVAWFGVETLSIAALVAGLATVALAGEGVRRVVEGTTLSVLGDGRPEAPIGLVPAIALIIGFGAAFALRTPDFTRDLHGPKEVRRSALVGLAVPLVLFGLVGAALQQSTGTWNIADVLRDLGSPTIAYLFVAVGFSGSVMSNLYSGALSLTDATRIGHRLALLAVASAGTALASLHFSKWMLPYLSAMALAAPPLIVLCWLSRGRRPDRAWRGEGVAAWGAGTLSGLCASGLGVGLALPIGLLTTCAVYALGSRGGLATSR